MSEKQVIDDILYYSKLSFNRMLVPGVSGNISVLYDGKVYITGTNTCLGNLTPEDIVVCDLEGNVLSGSLKPSKETELHALVYKTRPDASCVVHLHPMHVVALSLLNKTVPALTATFDAKLIEVPLIPFAPTGSLELFDSIVDALTSMKEGASLLTIARHGTLSFGKSLLEAFSVTDLAEDTAKTAFLDPAFRKA